MKMQIERIFVSSTRKDLIEERALVFEAIRHLQFKEVAMEYFGADPRESIEVCLERVRESNVYVGIIAFRYGQIVEETGMSYTQMEYEEAIKHDLPCLIYLRSDEHKIEPKYVEHDPESLIKLGAFKKKLTDSHTPSYFTTSTDLSLKIMADLSRRVKMVDYEVLNNYMSFISRRIRRLQEDDDAKFHYLQKKLEKLGVQEYSGFMCPVCGRLLEKDEPTFSAKHPVCTDCIVNRTEIVREQIMRDHPEMISWISSLRKEAEEYRRK